MKRLISKGMLVLLFCFAFIWLLPLNSNSICYAATLDTELLTNGGGDVNGGWTPVANNNEYSWSSISGGRTGNYFGIYASGLFSNEEQCYQEIDVSNLDFNNNNTIVNLNGYYMKDDSYSATYQNYVTIKFEQLDSSGNVLSTATRSSSVDKTWENFMISETILSTTKKIRVTLAGKIWGEGGGNLYVGFDDVSLKLSTPSNEAPIISTIDDQIMDSGNTLSPVSFTASDPESKPLTLSVTSSNTELISASGISASLTGTAGTISLTSVSGMTGVAEISVNVSDGVRNTTEKFFVTVYPNIQIGSNIVRNGDGTSLTGWTNPESRFDFGGVFKVGSVSPGSSTYFMYQDIDITKFSTYIDTGMAEFTSSCSTGSGGSFQVQGLDTSGNVLWTSASGTIALGTRTIRVKVGGPLNATIDNVNVTIVSSTIKMTHVSIQTALAGTTINNIPFTIIYPESGVTLTAVSDNQTIVPDSAISFGGSGYQRNISLSTVSGTHGTAVITIKGNGTTLDTFTVSTYTIPDAPTDVSVTDTTEGVVVNFTAPASDGGSTIINYKVISSPDSIIAFGTTDSIIVTGLTVGTTYTFTVRAINVIGEGYASISSPAIVMTAAPTVENPAIISITAYSATANAYITSDGSSTVIARGIEYKKSTDSTYTKIAAGAGGTGSFSVDLTGLSLNTLYDVRAFATNAKGTSYSNVVQFSTLNNTPPTISAISNPAAIDEDGATDNISFTIDDIETLSGSMSVTATSDNTDLIPDNPANIVLSGSDSNRTVQIIPSTNKSGTANITVTVTDALGETASQTFLVTVNAVNDAPVISDNSLNVTEDTSKDGTLTGIDSEGDSITFEAITQPQKGILTLNANGSYIYMPNANATGSDNFTFKAKDSALYSNTATITITIEAVNDAPVATALSTTFTEDIQGNATLTGLDVEGSTLTFSKVTDASHGLVTVNTDGSFTYLSNADYNGSDSFTFRVNDGSAASVPATVTIYVNAVNDAPAASDNTLNATEETLANATLQGNDIDGDSIIYEAVTQPVKGKLTLKADGTYTYMPNTNEIGNDSFTFRVKDASLYSNTATITITIAGVNDVPEALDNTLSVTEDTQKSGTLTGTDIDGDSLTYEAVTQPVKGTVTVNADGSYLYLPNTDATGSDSFTFKAKDASLYSNVATITITIAAVNDTPKANAGVLTVTEDTLNNGTLTGSDIEGDSLTYEAVTSPSKGKVTVKADGSFSYMPNANETGSDSFTFKVKDGVLYSNAATITITIEAVNDAPVATASSFSFMEDMEGKGTLSGTDMEGDFLTYSKVTNAVHGTVTVNADGSFVYILGADYNGSDSFTFKVNDSTLDSEPATVTINVSAGNDAPVAFNNTLNVTEDILKGGTLTGNDIDGDSLTYEVVTQSAKGKVTLKADGSYTYMPDTNVTGNDSFTFKAKDASLYSNLATITVNIAGVNDAPAANPGTLSVTEDTFKNGILTGTDIEGDNLTYEVVTQPLKGKLTPNADGSYTYMPNSNATGSDSFTFKVKDASLYSNTAAIAVTIAAVNDAPVASASSFTFDEDKEGSGMLSGTDIEDNALTFSKVTNAAHGTVTVKSDGSFTYLSNADYNGSDSFTFKVNDGSVDSVPATVTINVKLVNDAPTANAGTLTVTEDTLQNGTLTGSDIEGDSLTYAAVTQPAKGKVTVNTDGSYTYMPNADATGSDSFTFKVKDASLYSNIATVTVTITGVNDAPVVSDNTLNVTEETQKSGTLTGTDIDGDSLTYELVSQPVKGTVTVNSDGSYTYQPDTNVTGSDSFTYKAKDASLYSNTAAIMITITAVNDSPAANAGTLTVTEDTPKNGTLTGSDIDGDNLTYEIVTKPSKGTVTVKADGTYTYMPNTNATGDDSFTFKAKDASLYSNIATIMVTITGVNDAPEAKAATLSVAEDTQKNGTLTGKDIDGDSLTYEAVTQPAKGKVTVNADGSYTYMPDANATGSDSFTFRVKDTSLYSNPAAITVTITEVNDAPEANDGTLNTLEDTSKKGFLTGKDIDGDSLSYELVTKPTKGTVTINSDGSYDYMPNSNVSGSDNFTFRAKDALLYSNTATITVTITGGNDAPIANNDTLNVTEDTPGKGKLTGSDIDGDSVTYEIAANPSKGSVTVSADGTYTYMPNTNVTGNDSFTFKVKDASSTSEAATVAVTIIAVNDVPNANSFSTSVLENNSVTGTLSGSDIEGSKLTFIKTTDAANGKVTLNSDGSFTYIPSSNYSGNDSFTFKVNDGNIDSKPASVTITVTKVTTKVSLKDMSKSDDTYIIPTKKIINDIVAAKEEKVVVLVQEPASVQNNDQGEPEINLILKSEVIETAKTEDKSMVITVNDEKEKELYSWTFDTKELAASDKAVTDVNLSIGVSAVTKDIPGAETIEDANTAGVVLSFAHEGELPCQAKIRIYVGDQEGATPGATIYLYHYNKETNKLDILPNSSDYIVDEAGYVTIDIVHCSDYVVLFKEGASEQITSLIDQITVTPAKETLYYRGTIEASSNIKVTLPSTLILTENSDSNTNGIAIGAVTVTYTSDNTKVAVVNEKGRINAVGIGKAIITTTLTLYDGITKQIETTITVKKPYIKFKKSTILMKVGDHFTFIAEAYGVNMKDAKWSTTNKSIIAIDKKTGKAIAKSKGTVYVAVKTGDIIKKLKVVVK